MSKKPRYFSMDKDDLVWRKLDEDVDEWDKTIRTNEMYHAVGRLILKYKEGEPEVMHLAIRGGYNIVYRLEYQDGSSVVMRVPIRGIVQFPEEKVRYEVATMKYVAAHTTIPVPHIYHYGTATENPTGLGPFIIMDYIDHYKILNPNIPEEKLEGLYSQMANILLQLSNLRFPRIGSLVEELGTKEISVQGRPLISNMNDIIIHTNVPASILPSQSYTSTDEWLGALSDMHMAQLLFQRNDAVENEDDAHDKYVARQLFRNLAAKGYLTSQPPSSQEDFRLFSEDFRPTNVLLDKNLRVVGVIDWEFAYAAPSQFSFDPPWWLLLQGPQDWDDGCRDWLKAYEPRLQTFLRVLEAEEKKIASTNLAQKIDGLVLTDDRVEEAPLSQRMRESWEKKTWMTNYAARQSWSFDFLWWKFLDDLYYGPNQSEGYRSRLQFLSPSQKAAMEAFVGRKMEESESRNVVQWENGDAERHLAEVLVWVGGTQTWK